MLLRALVLGVAMQLQGVDYVSRAAPPPAETVVDGVVATLELTGDSAPRYVLRSEYTLLLRTELLSHGMPDALNAPVSEASAWPVLETLIAETLAVREDERSALGNLSTLDPAAVGALRARYREEIVRRQRLDPADGEPAIARLLASTGLSQGDFDTLLRRRLVARAYLEARHETLLEVSEVDLRRAVESQRYADRCAVEAEQRRCVRAEVQWSSLPGALRQYLRSLGGRVRVRIFSDAGAAP
jgi:hypothetical protein